MNKCGNCKKYGHFFKGIVPVVGCENGEMCFSDGIGRMYVDKNTVLSEEILNNPITMVIKNMNGVIQHYLIPCTRYDERK